MPLPFKKFKLSRANTRKYLSKHGRIKIKHASHDHRGKLLAKDDTRTGYIYVVNIGMDLYKIGKTLNFDKRLSDLKTGNPSAQPEIVMRVVDRHAVERALHVKFKKSHRGREIFQLSDADLDVIREMLVTVALTPSTK